MHFIMRTHIFQQVSGEFELSTMIRTVDAFSQRNASNFPDEMLLTTINPCTVCTDLKCYCMHYGRRLHLCDN